MGYKHYDTFDFLNDEFFVLWVKNPTTEANQFWEDWISQHRGKVDTIELARKIILSAEFEKLHVNAQEKSELLAGLLSQLDKPYTSVSKNRSFRQNRVSFSWQKVAAAVVLLIASIFIFYQSHNKDNVLPVSPDIAKIVTNKNPAGTKSKIKLPDGSIAFLNSNSEMSFPEVFQGNRREVHLKGEAYFEVKENKQVPFIVTAYDVETEALGTSFNVKTIGNGKEIEVSLVEGKIRVTHLKQNRELILNPEEQAMWRSEQNSFNKSRFDPHYVIAWTKNTLNFRDASFEEVIRRLSDWYGVEFIVQRNSQNFTEYNGSFKNKSLELILENLSFTSNISYKIKGDTVFIK